jgi:hypothetical protein
MDAINPIRAPVTSQSIKSVMRSLSRVGSVATIRGSQLPKTGKGMSTVNIRSPTTWFAVSVGIPQPGKIISQIM